MTQPTQDQAVNEWMISLGFEVVGTQEKRPLYRHKKKAMYLIDTDQALFFYTICQKAEREALQSLLEKLDDLPFIEHKGGQFVHWNEIESTVKSGVARLTPLQNTKQSKNSQEEDK